VGAATRAARGALQAVASRLTLHFVVPFAVVSQQLTAPVAPHVDLTAHLRTAAAHSRVSVFAFMAVLTVPTTHFT